MDMFGILAMALFGWCIDDNVRLMGVIYDLSITNQQSIIQWQGHNINSKVSNHPHMPMEHTAQKATVQEVTTMLATSENVLFTGHNHLLTTGADDPTL